METRVRALREIRFDSNIAAFHMRCSPFRNNKLRTRSDERFDRTNSE